MVLDKQLYNEINEYCKLNDLKTRDFIHKILKEGFMKEKYGDSPFKFTSVPQLPDNAVKKIEDLVENQFPLPPEVIEPIDNKSVEPKKEIEEIKLQEDIYTGKVEDEIISVQTIQGVETISEPLIPKKKRKLK